MVLTRDVVQDRIHTLRDIPSLGPYFFSPPDYSGAIASKIFDSTARAVTRPSPLSLSFLVLTFSLAGDVLTAATSLIASLPSSAFLPSPPGVENDGEKLILSSLNDLVAARHAGESGKNASKEVMTPLRHALTGQKVGAGVPSTIAVLGREEVLRRFGAVLELVGEV